MDKKINFTKKKIGLIVIVVLIVLSFAGGILFASLNRKTEDRGMSQEKLDDFLEIMQSYSLDPEMRALMDTYQEGYCIECVLSGSDNKAALSPEQYHESAIRSISYVPKVDGCIRIEIDPLPPDQARALLWRINLLKFISVAWFAEPDNEMLFEKSTSIVYLDLDF